jgi:hypothetical protein
VPGRSGFCTVARSDGMRDALVLRIEQLSYYEHRALSGGQEQAICACRVIEIRGSRYHVLSRIQDAGLDFTNRTNFLAHHLVFAPEELKSLPVAPVIFRDWDGWKASWREEPRVLRDESWGNLYDLAALPNIPANSWAEVTGDAVNGIELVDTSTALFLNWDGLTEAKVLGLFAESLELLEVRDAIGDYRSNAWQFSFTTLLQDQDPAGDFWWRGLNSSAPALRKVLKGGQSVIPIGSVRASRPTNDEISFAKNGRQPLGISIQPEDVQVQEGSPAILKVGAMGVPPANRFEWYSCARDGQVETLLPERGAELQLDSPPVGVSRYAVKLSNARGESVWSRVIEISVDPQIRPAGRSVKRGDAPPSAPVHAAQKPSAPVHAAQTGGNTARKKVEETSPDYYAPSAELAQHLEKVAKNKRKNRIFYLLLIMTVMAVLVAAVHYGPQLIKLLKTQLNREGGEAGQEQGSMAPNPAQVPDREDGEAGKEQNPKPLDLAPVAQKMENSGLAPKEQETTQTDMDLDAIQKDVDFMNLDAIQKDVDFYYNSANFDEIVTTTISYGVSKKVYRTAQGRTKAKKSLKAKGKVEPLKNLNQLITSGIRKGFPLAPDGKKWGYDDKTKKVSVQPYPNSPPEAPPPTTPSTKK